MSTDPLVPKLFMDTDTVISPVMSARAKHTQGAYLGQVQPVAYPKGEPTPDMIRLSLRKILSSELFALEETLAGRGCDLKQYVLGLEVFGRKDSFDPQSDPIVRVGAMRVRAKLKDYYETEGQEDSVLIEFPRGYMPVFRWRHETSKNCLSVWFRLKRAFAALTTGVLLAVRHIRSGHRRRR